MVEQSNSTATHSPLDLVPHWKPNKNTKAALSAMLAFLFHDRLRHVAVTKLDVDPTRLPGIADLLFAIPPI